MPCSADGRRERLRVAHRCPVPQLLLTKGGAGQRDDIGGPADPAGAERLVKLHGVDPGMVWRVTDRTGHECRCALDRPKTGEGLGWAPPTGLAGGLAETTARSGQRRGWWPPARDSEHRP
jgi:dTDP-D-glucose 4,6-dehydratase